MRMRLLAALGLAIVAFCALTPRSGARADEGWVVRSFDAHVTVNADGTIRVDENIVADFGALPSHGIFRDLPLTYPYDSHHDRLTPISNVSVSDAGGQPFPFPSSRTG